jgi:hypothetical protein
MRLKHLFKVIACSLLFHCLNAYFFILYRTSIFYITKYVLHSIYKYSYFCTARVTWPPDVSATFGETEAHLLQLMLFIWWLCLWNSLTYCKPPYRINSQSTSEQSSHCAHQNPCFHHEKVLHCSYKYPETSASFTLWCSKMWSLSRQRVHGRSHTKISLN